MNHPATGQSQQNAHIRPIRGNCIRSCGTSFSHQVTHQYPPQMFIDAIIWIVLNMTLVRNGINGITENFRPLYASFGCPKRPFVSGSSQLLGRKRLFRERIGKSEFQLCYYLDGVQRSCQLIKILELLDKDDLYPSVFL